MPVIPCIKSENECFPCAGDSSNPLANLSTEAPDLNIWLNVHFGVVTNVTPNSWRRDTCVGFCESSISQIDADDCARRRALECLHVPPLPPIPPEPPPLPPPQEPAICNQEVTCNNGETCYTVPACTVFAANQMEANAIATSLCETRVNNPETASPCAAPPPPPPPPPAPSEPPLDTTCGVPLYRISGYNSTIAQSIVDMMPNSNDSFLPEWDGVFRDDGESGLRSHSECYAILGKEIELQIFLNSTVIQEVNCTFGGNPGFWNHSVPGDCSFCSDNLEFTFASSDRISISNGLDTTVILANLGMGGVGGFKTYDDPSCGTFAGPYELFYVPGDGDIAIPQYGPVLFTVTAIP